MARAPFQVLTIPFLMEEETLLCCLFRRSDSGIWQFVAGGGEEGETPLQAAQRETLEETGLAGERWLSLDTVSSIPTDCFHEKSCAHWGEECLVIPEYTFALQADEKNLTLSREHLEYRWVTFSQAEQMLRYDSNKTALWELEQRIRKGLWRLSANG